MECCPGNVVVDDLTMPSAPFITIPKDERLAWQAICERYPEQWVVLVHIDWPDCRTTEVGGCRWTRRGPRCRTRRRSYEARRASRRVRLLLHEALHLLDAAERASGRLPVSNVLVEKPRPPARDQTRRPVRGMGTARGSTAAISRLHDTRAHGAAAGLDRAAARLAFRTPDRTEADRRCDR